MTGSIRKLISKKITKAMREFDLLAPGDRVLLGVSGGKDSTTLLWELHHRRGRIDPQYTLEAMHLQSDFGELRSAAFLQDICGQLGVPLHIVPVSIQARVKPNQKLNCWWCSSQRRASLMEFARVGGFNKLALGHHMDDMLETLLMNMLYQGEIGSMPPQLTLDKYPLTLIRPLAFVENHELRRYVEDLGFAQYTCTCEFSQHSQRLGVREHIQNLTGGSATLKRNLFESMRHIQGKYLPPPLTEPR